MWLVGVLALLIISSGFTMFLGRKQRRNFSPVPWNVGDLSTAYTIIVGPLAAFTIASTLFLANLNVVRASRSFVDVIALFLIGFIMLVGTAIMFATNRGKLTGASQGAELPFLRRVMFILSNVGFYLGLTVSWLGLRPLLVSLEIKTLADVFTWLLAFTVFAGAARLSSWLYSLLGVKAVACVSIPLIGLLTPGIYVGILMKAFPSLRLAQNSTLVIGVLTFALGTMAFAWDTVMIALEGTLPINRAIQRGGVMALLAYVQAIVTAVGLLWYTVAMS
jgi:hypothetical protein